MARAALTPGRVRGAVGLDLEALLLRVLAEQARQRETLDRVVQLLERSRGPRDAADVALLVAIAEVFGDRSFTSAQLVAHADADQTLREALEAADITTAQELGCVCRRLQLITLSGLRLERVGGQRAGVVWRVQVCDD